MHRRREVPGELLQLAAEQAGVVTRRQVLTNGVSRQMLERLVDSREWRRISPGLFSTRRNTPSWLALAWGGTLIGGPRARLGPEASGYLYDLVRTAPRPIDVLVPEARPHRVEGPWRFLREAPGVRPTWSPGSPPRLPAECAVLDLVAQRAATDVVGLIIAAVQKGHTKPSRLRDHLATRTRQRHRDLINGVLADLAEGVRSYLELMYLHDVERAHGLPRGDRQDVRSDLPYYRDVKYERYRLLVELDGRIGHEGEGLFRDLDRDNRHALRDELTLRYGYVDVSGRACVVAYQVFMVLASRGYAEPFGRCARCADLSEAYLRSG